MSKFNYLMVLLLSFSVSALGQDYYSDIWLPLSKIYEQHTESTELFVLGQSDEDPIWGIRIGTGDIHQLVVSGHHGNEIGSIAQSIRLARSLAEDPLENRTIFVIPSLIPETFGSKRHLNSVDPNRNYPGPCGSNDTVYSSEAFSLRATALLRDFIDPDFNHEYEKRLGIPEINIVAALSLHNKGNTVHYPYSFQENALTPDATLFKELLNEAFEEGPYEVGLFPTYYYTMQGSFIDWAYWAYGIWAVLIEMGTEKDMSEGELDSDAKYSIPAMRYFLKNAPEHRTTPRQAPACDLNKMSPLGG